jgi:hypothetical protein
MLKVSDIITREVLTLDMGASAAEARAQLVARRVSGAPVVDRGRVVGVLSTADLLRSQATTVSELMTPFTHFVRPDDDAQLAVDLLLAEQIHRVVVVGAGASVVGIVTPADILRAERGASLGWPNVWPHADPASAVLDEEDF